MRSEFIKIVVMAIGIATMSVLATAQGTFKPRNADEEHAWRLYEQYKTSKKTESEIRVGITQTSGDIKTVNVGSVPGLGIDPGDVARLAKLREQLAAEQQRQQNLENAWDKKFFGRYGDLADSAGTIYDPKTKKTIDKIQFRLMYFPFYVNDGVYSGTIAGAPGSINLTVNGTSVTGTVRGTYKYTLFDETYSEPFTGKVTGTLSDKGGFSGSLSGTVGGGAFTGTLSGTISKGVAKGSWTTQALTTASGTFTARRK